MALLRPTYPPGPLGSVKKGPQAVGKPPLLRELSNTIGDLLDNDPDVHRLIKGKANLDPPYKFADLSSILDDPDVLRLIKEKASPKFSDLVARSNP